jgi:hypothetical protein
MTFLNNLVGDLRKCYDEIAKLDNIQARLEHFDVIELVAKYRTYWKPENVKVVLLAESHVYTQKLEMNSKINLVHKDVDGCFREYVRFVYCLGYGEDSLLKDKHFLTAPNIGTLPFWKIFHSCCNEITEANYRTTYNFLKKSHTGDGERISNKINLLKRMRRHGIWLVDTSIVGLYQPGGERFGESTLCDNIISVSWNNHVKNVVEEASPEYIICIGKGVASIIQEDLDKMVDNKKIDDYEILSQPTPFLGAGGLMKEFMKYYEICSRYCDFDSDSD